MMLLRCIYTAAQYDATRIYQFRSRAIRLTLHTDYALRILLQAAAARGERLSIAGVAEQHGISRNHAMKVVNTLANAGLLTTTRGRGGGFVLARDPKAITLGEVVRLTEPDVRPANCGDCSLRMGCGITPMLAAAMQAFLDTLDRQTLADALAGSTFPIPAPESAD